MEDNAPSHAAKASIEYLNSLGLKNDRLIKWLVCSPGLNPIENLWSMLKRRLYQSGRQFSSKDQLWDELQSCAASISSDKIENLTKLMDKHLLAVVESQGGYIKH